MIYSEKIALEDFLIKRKESVEQALNCFCCAKPDDIPARLWDSMCYSLMAGGKRLRPILCIEAALTFGSDLRTIMPFALALEMIHTASLIHDDLPCMDNDSLRRGKPTNHMKFGESLALMAGTSLFLIALEYPLKKCSTEIAEKNLLEALQIILKAAGPSGIHGGQTLDTDLQSQLHETDFVWKIALQKTSCLIQASVLCGATIAGANIEECKIMSTYSKHLGLAFQIVDDILDVRSEASHLGKTPGKDQEQGKLTFISSYGYDKTVQLAREESQRALDEAVKLGCKGLFFKDLALYLENRTK